MEALLENKLVKISIENSDRTIIENGTHINDLIGYLRVKLEELDTAAKTLMRSLSNGDLWSVQCKRR